jgi:hypothetical protein
MKVVTFSITDEHLAWLRGKKTKYHVSASQVIRDILDDEIKNEQAFGETEWFKTEVEMRRHVDNENARRK